MVSAYLMEHAWIEDSDLHLAKNISNLIKCVLPGKRLNDGQPVNCLDSIYSLILFSVVVVLGEMLSL